MEHDPRRHHLIAKRASSILRRRRDRRIQASAKAAMRCPEALHAFVELLRRYTGLGTAIKEDAVAGELIHR